MLLFFGVADDVDDDGAGRVDDCSVVYYHTFHLMGKCVLLCCLVLMLLLSLLIHQMDPHHLMNNKLGVRGLAITT